ncbi:hypothetical protein AKO1_010364 [Acrasis kona]|uniref:Uncharacterized protein n=1 Tax=Acrasis kona TaxID=1008807 RepID=A0AAW2YQ30_9EUKA
MLSWCNSESKEIEWNRFFDIDLCSYIKEGHVCCDIIQYVLGQSIRSLLDQDVNCVPDALKSMWGCSNLICRISFISLTVKCNFTRWWDGLVALLDEKYIEGGLESLNQFCLLWTARKSKSNGLANPFVKSGPLSEVLRIPNLNQFIIWSSSLSTLVIEKVLRQVYMKFFYNSTYDLFTSLLQCCGELEQYPQHLTVLIKNLSTDLFAFDKNWLFKYLDESTRNENVLSILDQHIFTWDTNSTHRFLPLDCAQKITTFIQDDKHKILKTSRHFTLLLLKFMLQLDKKEEITDMFKSFDNSHLMDVIESIPHPTIKEELLQHLSNHPQNNSPQQPQQIIPSSCSMLQLHQSLHTTNKNQSIKHFQK